MTLAPENVLLSPALESALAKRGFTSLTPVQLAVLDSKLDGRDLRITSQTGSGKTVAVGFVIREIIEGNTHAKGPVARPRALVIAPTRELAKQFEEELSWLFAEARVRVVSVTGGADARDERRALSQGPAVVVGTPGRLLDHLDRGAIDGEHVQAIVLDEADRLLDMGFRDDLEKILSFAKNEHRTHLVSATFPREVKSLADRVQKDAALVEGTRLGAANVDIDHVLYLVAGHERLSALVNVLLSHMDEQTLVFARTRADVARIAKELTTAGFRVAQLSGEMEQAARNRALAAFKAGEVNAMVATDVAARGIDVQDITRVVHFDPPGDPDTYTHRSGRTGRAGKKGTSALLLPPSALVGILRLLGRARVKHRFEPVPSASDIRRTQLESFERELTAEGDDKSLDEATWTLAKKLIGSDAASRAVARLISRARKARGPEPRDVRPMDPPVHRSNDARDFRDSRESREPREFRDGPPMDRSRFEWRAPPRQGDSAPPPRRGESAPSEPEQQQPRLYGEGSEAPAIPRARKSHRSLPESNESSEQRPPPRERPARAPKPTDRTWVQFRVTWGGLHGADVRRLLPIVCRRGEIDGGDVGAIKVDRTFSVVQIASDVAESFAKAAAKPDPRDPRIQIVLEDGPPPAIPRERPSRARVDTPKERVSRPRIDAPKERASRPRIDKPHTPRPPLNEDPRPRVRVEASTRWKRPEGGATPPKRKPKP